MHCHCKTPVPHYQTISAGDTQQRSFHSRSRSTPTTIALERVSHHWPTAGSQSLNLTKLDVCHFWKTNVSQNMQKLCIHKNTCRAKYYFEYDDCCPWYIEWVYVFVCLFVFPRHRRSLRTTLTLSRRTMTLAAEPASRLKMTSSSLGRALGWVGAFILMLWVTASLKQFTKNQQELGALTHLWMWDSSVRLKIQQ